MKKRLDPLYFKISLYVFCTAAAIILFWRLLDSSTDLWKSFCSTMQFLRGMLAPFFLALVLAYILAPAAGVLEMLLGKIWRKVTHKRRLQIASILTIYIILVALVAVAISYIIPGVARNIVDLVGNMPGYVNRAMEIYNEIIVKEPFIYLKIDEYVNESILKGQELLSSWVPQIVPGLAQGVISVIGGIINGILGVILSLYLLMERNNIGQGGRRLLRAWFGEERTRRITSLLSAVDKVFGRFISSKLLESLIVFVVVQTAFLFIGVRYSLLMSTIVALTNLVPYIGPIIGGAVPVLVTLLDDPVKALIVLIALLVVQGADAYFIAPKLMGDKMGLSPFWVLLVIILGGGFFGLWGILLAVPVAAVIRLIISQYIRSRSLSRQNGSPAESTDSPSQ